MTLEGKERAAASRCQWQRAVLIAIIVVMAACAGADAALDKSAREAEAVRTGHMAYHAGVGATKREVDAFMKGAFRPGMMRDEVIARLNALFDCYELLPLDVRTHEPEDDWDYVRFSGQDCTCAKFKARESDCSSMGYSFDFDGDVLVEVSWYSD
jgi:hypothetical protein